MHSIKKKLKIFFHTISYFMPYILSTANSLNALPPKAPPTPPMIPPITAPKGPPIRYPSPPTAFNPAHPQAQLPAALVEARIVLYSTHKL